MEKSLKYYKADSSKQKMASLPCPSTVMFVWWCCVAVVALLFFGLETSSLSPPPAFARGGLLRYYKGQLNQRTGSTSSLFVHHPSSSSRVETTTTTTTTANVRTKMNNDRSRGILTSFTVERVSDRRRALDLQVFRQWTSQTVEEYIQQQQEWMMDMHGGEDSHCHNYIDEQIALQHLTPGIDDNGQDTTFVGGVTVVSFVAILVRDNDDDHDDDRRFFQFHRTHGVVGAIDVKFDNDTTSNDVVLYLNNLCVDPNVRQCGIGTALVVAVKDFATSQLTQQQQKNERDDDNNLYSQQQKHDNSSKLVEIVLHVERTNVGAIALYEKQGFVFFTTNDDDYLCGRYQVH